MLLGKLYDGSLKVYFGARLSEAFRGCCSHVAVRAHPGWSFLADGAVCKVRVEQLAA